MDEGEWSVPLLWCREEGPETLWSGPQVDPQWGGEWQEQEKALKEPAGSPSGRSTAHVPQEEFLGKVATLALLFNHSPTSSHKGSRRLDPPSFESGLEPLVLLCLGLGFGLGLPIPF